MNDHTLDGGGKNSFISKNFRIEFVNAKEDLKGELPMNIEDVRERIKLGIWIDARVVKLEYDSVGYVTRARIEPVLY